MSRQSPSKVPGPAGLATPDMQWCRIGNERRSRDPSIEVLGLKIWVAFTVLTVPIALGIGFLAGLHFDRSSIQKIVEKPTPIAEKVDKPNNTARDLAQMRSLGAMASISLMSCYATVHLDTIMRDYPKSFQDQTSCAEKARSDLNSPTNEAKAMLASHADDLKLLADWYSSWITDLNSVADMSDVMPAQSALEGKMNLLLTRIQFET